MPAINFKISDGQKYEFLWTLLNPNYNEENDWAIETVICEVYDNYAVVRNLAENTFERIYYSKNDETDSLEITNRERCFIVDINEDEKTALDNLHTAGGATFAEIGNNFTTQTESINTLNQQIETLNGQIADFTSQISDLNTQISDFNAKISEHEASISTLSTENETLTASLTAANETIEARANELSTLQATVTALTTERDNLVAYKNTVIAEQKKAIITSYTNQLSEEVIESFLTNIDNYELDQLDMILTYEVKKANPALFAKQVPNVPAYVPKDNGGAATNISDILAKYEK